MTDKTSSDEDRGGLGLLLGLGAALVLAAGYAGYKLGDARAASGFGGGRPCAGCAEKAEAEAEAYADPQTAAPAANGAGPADVTAGAPGASVG